MSESSLSNAKIFCAPNKLSLNGDEFVRAKLHIWFSFVRSLLRSDVFALCAQIKQFPAKVQNTRRVFFVHCNIARHRMCTTPATCYGQYIIICSGARSRIDVNDSFENNSGQFRSKVETRSFPGIFHRPFCWTFPSALTYGLFSSGLMPMKIFIWKL